mmetsp:Transcript_57557/g.149594  ORF Transcript_57557/g.149594 Transcript_57557/m.149594 type:complete len:272 (-) Transcript_57557:1175-1990(-)
MLSPELSGTGSVTASVLGCARQLAWGLSGKSAAPSGSEAAHAAVPHMLDAKVRVTPVTRMPSRPSAFRSPSPGSPTALPSGTVSGPGGAGVPSSGALDSGLSATVQSSRLPTPVPAPLKLWYPSPPAELELSTSSSGGTGMARGRLRGLQLVAASLSHCSSMAGSYTPCTPPEDHGKPQQPMYSRLLYSTLSLTELLRLSAICPGASHWRLRPSERSSLKGTGRSCTVVEALSSCSSIIAKGSNATSPCGSGMSSERKSMGFPSGFLHTAG